VNFHIVAFERAQRFFDRPRLVIGLCAAVAVALIAAVPGFLTSADSGRTVRAQAAAQATPASTDLPGVGVLTPVDAPPPPGTVPPSPTTTAPALVLGTTFNRPTTTIAHKASAAPAKAAAPSPAPAPNGSTPTSVCHNSYDAACGAFSWAPDPGPNQPITGAVTASPPGTDGKVTFTVNGDDPDAAPLQVCNIDFGDNQGFHCDPRPAVDPSYCPAQHGPWTPPAKNDGKLTNFTQDHTYTAPGTYHVLFDVRSAMQECNNPYASQAVLSVDVVVT
jgi:hypothetical protein